MSKHTVGRTVQCVRPEDGLTFGKRYYVADEDYSSIAVINDTGVRLWFPDDCFRDALEMTDERIVELEAALVKEGPLNAEAYTLDEVLETLEKWKRIASGKTCVSFERLCYGASSMWHQTHRENFRKVDRKPESLSRWVLDHAGSVRNDFPEQVLEILCALKDENKKLLEQLVAS